MNVINDLLEILLANSWQENLNIWKFDDKVVTIKKYSTPNLISSVEYAIEKTSQGKYLLKTKDENFGDLVLTLDYKNSLPRLILQSLQSRERYFELQAFNKVSNDQKFIIKNQIKELKRNFEFKKDEIISRTQHLKKTSSPDIKIFINECEGALNKLKKVESEIEMLEKVIFSTINVATNFQAYEQRITTDITNLQEEISNIFKT